MQNILTLLTPSAALPGQFSKTYKAQKQLERYEKLLEKPGALTATKSNLEAAHRYFKAQASGALTLLDNMEISDTPLPTEDFGSASFKEALAKFEVTYNRPGQSAFWLAVEAASRAAAVRRWDTRLQIEAFEATEKQWFLVFDTITYDPSQFRDEVMFGKYWRKYQRSVQHAVLRRAYGSLKRFRRSAASFTDHVRYFAVPESHKDGRTHLHILWFLSHLPDTCQEADPNAHLPARPRRQVSDWPAYPYGIITMRLPVRYKGDAFTTRLGWRLPLDKSGKRPILKDSVAVARYMSKYLSKSKPENLKCRRIRTSPRLGLISIQVRLSTLTNSQICLLYRSPRQSLVKRALHGVSIPNSLLRSQCLREMCRRLRSHLNLNPGPMRITYDTLLSVMAINSRPQLQEHFSNSILQAAMSRLQSFISSLTSTMKNTDISEVTSLFTDYVKPLTQFCHAPSFAPSLGVLI